MGRLRGRFGHLGGCWSIILGILGGHEAVLGGLGAVLCPQDRPANFTGATCVDFWTVLESQKAAQTTPRRHPETPRWPKRRQDGAQDEQKSMINFALKTIPFWIRLKTVLGRSWPHLGVDFGSKTLENVIFRENRRFRKNIVSRRVLGRSWVDLGGQRGRLGRPWGVKLGVRRSQGLVLGGLKALRS